VSIPTSPTTSQTFEIAPAIFNNYNLQLSLKQPIFTGFQLESNKDIAEYSSQAAEHDYAADRVTLTYNIKSAYWQLFKATEVKKVVDDNVDQIQAHLKDVQNFFDQGMVTNNEVLKVQVQLSDAQLRQIDAENNVRLTKMALNNLIGLPLMTDIDITSSPENQQKQFDRFDDLIKKATENRSEVKAMESRVSAGQSGVTLAKSGWYPQIYLTGDYYYDRPNQRLVPTQDKFYDTWDVGVGLSMPLWNWRTAEFRTTEAETQVAALQDALGQMKDGISLEVAQNYLNFAQAKQRIAVADQTVKQADENNRVTNDKYKQGLVTNTDAIDAEAALVQAKLNYTQTLVDYELAQAGLEKAIGE
jgi:outer membrane protein TolC